MKLLIVDNADLVDKQFNDALIQSVSGLTECDVVNYTEIPTHENIVDQYCGVILSGVPVHYSFESIEDRLSYFGWLRTTHLPVLGICLAHQAMGMLFGATLLRDIEAASGINVVQVVKSDPIFNNMSPTFETYTLHRASITVPNEFELLGSSTVCKNEIMKHKKKPIYGVQFHPELSGSDTKIIENFIAIAHT